MKVIGTNILINQIKEDVKTESGLLLSSDDTSKFRYQKGKVIEPGSEVSVVKKGDTIYYDESRGYTMLIENEKFTIIQLRDVVVVL
jgi:co-chaperonin GroES (HSP10)